ncbi:MAG: DUF3842 family protein [Chloroflexi bacterium]|nr:DUF3842 family protein [Chloroflexota bacterium]
MVAIQRLYLYLVAYISLTVMALGASNIIRAFWRGNYTAGEISLNIALVLVGLPIYLLHWTMAQRRVRRHEEHRQTFLRQLYLYAVLAQGVGVFLSQGTTFLQRLLSFVLGVSPFQVFSSQAFDETVPRLFIWGLLWIYHYRLIKGDAQQELPVGWSDTPRRLYTFGFALFALGPMAGVGAYNLIRGLFQQVLGLSNGEIFVRSLVNAVPFLVVGGLVWLTLWQWAQQRVAGLHAPPPDASGIAETQTVLRRLYLYVVVFGSALITLWSLSLILYRLFLIVLGEPAGPVGNVLRDFTDSLAAIIVAVAIWIYHWRILELEATRQPEAPQQASVRRLYFYLVALISLVLFSMGMAGLCNVLIQVVGRWQDLGTELSVWRNQVSLYTSMVIVGIPVWSVHWHRMQSAALAGSVSGLDERRSLFRKIYLYFSVFVAVVTVLGSTAWLVYNLLRGILGDQSWVNFIPDLGRAFSYSLIATVVWLYHWRALQQDASLGSATNLVKSIAIPGIGPVVAIIDGGDGSLGVALIQALRQYSASIRLVGWGLTPEAQVSLATVLSKDIAQLPEEIILQQAQFLIGPLEMLIPGSFYGKVTPEVVRKIQTSPARKFLLPASGYQIIGLRPTNREALIAETVTLISDSINIPE